MEHTKPITTPSCIKTTQKNPKKFFRTLAMFVGKYSREDSIPGCAIQNYCDSSWRIHFSNLGIPGSRRILPSRETKMTGWKIHQYNGMSAKGIWLPITGSLGRDVFVGKLQDVAALGSMALELGYSTLRRLTFWKNGWVKTGGIKLDPAWGNQTSSKCMVILRDFRYKNALFGLVQ